MARLGLLGALALALSPLVGCAAAPTSPPVAPAAAVVLVADSSPVDTLPPDFDVAAPAVEPPAAPRFHEPVVPRADTRVVVLEYHALGDIDDPMFVPAAAFAEQVRWLADNHVEVVRMSELEAWMRGELELPALAAVITLDDGHKSARRIALPLLARAGMPFTLALNTAAIEEERVGAMTWDDVREVLKSGLCEIASHSHIHGFMARMTDASNRKELSLSREIIEERTGVHATAFVFPFGSLSPRLVKLTEQAGYDVAFAAWGPTVGVDSPRFRLGRYGVTRDMDLATFSRPFRAAAGSSRGGHASTAR
jgi:peptidoglycan/xylan/chitin deacetylase (PgdA/CDA1 family)